MSDTIELDPPLRPIADLCDGEVSYRTDGWRQLIFMERLKFFANGSERTMDALLCLNHNNPSYPTKLYLAERLGGSLNWNEEAYILGRRWFTFSWRDVPASLPYIDIVAAHLRALDKGAAA
jgi:hypothetical protein